MLPTEFDCTDCGDHVVSFPMVDLKEPVCMTCQFLRTVQDPKEREEIRKLLRLVKKS